MRIMGIDPGRYGALALHDGATIAHAWAFPSNNGKEMDWFRIKERMLDWHPDLAVIERVGAMPGEGVMSAFTFGYIAGALRGITIAFDFSVELVPPQVWRKAVLVGYPKPPKGDTKARKQVVVDWAMKRYPTIPLLATPRCRVPHSGMCDAMAIATWAAMRYGGNTVVQPS